MTTDDSLTFAADAAILTSSDDRLGRSSFAKRLAAAIVRYASTATSQNALVVGLLGEWGSGKSSILNMVEEELASTYSGATSAIVLRRFNPWYYPPQDELISRFFAFLSDAIDRPDAAESLRKSAKLFKTIARVAQPLEHLPGAAGVIVKAGVLGLTATAQSSTNIAEGLETLESVKAQITDVLAISTQKLVLVIDDLDRLAATELRQIFQLVKSVADFPNVVYILAFDDANVAKALAADFIDGRAFLEKIVNVPVRVPAISIERVQNLLLSDLISFFRREVGRSFPEQRFWSLYSAGPNQLVKSLRDSKRFLNTFFFTYGIVAREVDLIDFFGITMLQVFSPDVYQAVLDNPGAVIDTPQTIFEGDQKNPTANRSRLDAALSGCTQESRDTAFPLLKELFPKVRSAVDKVQYTIANDGQNRKDMRISTLEHFPTYFQLALREGAMSRDQFREVLNQVGAPDDVSTLIGNMESEETLRNFLELVLIADSTELDQGKARALVLGLLKAADQFENDDFGAPLRASMAILVMQGLTRLFGELPNDDARFDLAIEAIGQQGVALTSCTMFVSFVEQERKRPRDKYRFFEELSNERARALVKAICDKLRAAAADDSLASCPRLLYVLGKWAKWEGPEAAQPFVTRLVSTDEGLVKVVAGASQRPADRYFVADAPIGVNRQTVGKYVNLEAAEQRLKRLSSDQRSRFSDEQQAAIRAFLSGKDYNIGGWEPNDE